MGGMRRRSRDVIKGGDLSASGRLIPQRGQVKLGILLLLFHSVSSAISFTSRSLHLS
ncbi:hypothetical protein G2W53_042640 [Senna tora]|uniref:Uncharacterized protein n=1 Tax=Senna tora TaxID=362788 RepID=A0A834SH93_9FABA|nr:hypothetical protein G2W53_042640 [Senna tora]